MVSSHKNHAYSVEVINERNTLGEGPYWDKEHKRLYWVDMPEMLIYSYDPETGKIAKATVNVEPEVNPVTLVIRVDDTKDMFVIALKGKLALIQWDGVTDKVVEPKHLLDVVEDTNRKSRCNDGKVDPSNRLWVGTMGEQLKHSHLGNEFESDKGEMFKIEFDESQGIAKRFLDKMQIPNGLEWSLDKDKFYLVDSLTNKVTEYTYDDQKGTIGEDRVVFDLEAAGLVGKPNSLPDGMTIDKDGFLWIAVYGTGKVIRIDPKNGHKDSEIVLDKVLQPTSVCFGGENLDTLYVTSAHVDWTPDYEQEYPDSGKLFKITNLGTHGVVSSRPVKIPKKLLEKIYG